MNHGGANSEIANANEKRRSANKILIRPHIESTLNCAHYNLKFNFIIQFLIVSDLYKEKERERIYIFTST